MFYGPDIPAINDKIDSSFFGDNKMTRFIAHDLYQNIVEYLPYACLQYVSKASPLFDVAICNAGIKLFYDKNHWYDISGRNSVVIEMTESKQKYVLYNLGPYWYLPIVGKNIRTKTIRWTFLEKLDPEYYNRYYDSEKGMSAYIGSDSIYFAYGKCDMHCTGHIEDRNEFGFVDSIDMTSKIVSGTIIKRATGYHFTVESFDIICRDGRWT